jgi:hypothetical protein
MEKFRSGIRDAQIKSRINMPDLQRWFSPVLLTPERFIPDPDKKVVFHHFIVFKKKFRIIPGQIQIDNSFKKSNNIRAL